MRRLDLGLATCTAALAIACGCLQLQITSCEHLPRLPDPSWRGPHTVPRKGAALPHPHRAHQRQRLPGELTS